METESESSHEKQKLTKSSTLLSNNPHNPAIVRCLRGWVCGPEPWKINFSVSFSGDRHATYYYFSFNKHASNCWHKLSFRQFVLACHRCNYTIVEGGNLRTHLTSLTKILKIVWEKWPSRWNATQSDQIMCHTGAGWTFYHSANAAGIWLHWPTYWWHIFW